jgi:DNA-binding transcriptional ArsR family regulator
MKRDIFQALADPSRRAIISLIALQAMTPNALSAHFDISRQAVSKHIKVLVESEIIYQDQQGREIFYHLNPQRIKEAADWLLPFKQLWEDKFSQLDQVLSNLSTKNQTLTNE